MRTQPIKDKDNDNTPADARTLATDALGCDVRGIVEWGGAFAIMIGRSGAKVMASRATLANRRVCAARVANLLRVRANVGIDHDADDLWEKAVGLFMADLDGETRDKGQGGGIEK